MTRARLQTPSANRRPVGGAVGGASSWMADLQDMHAHKHTTSDTHVLHQTCIKESIISHHHGFQRFTWNITASGQTQKYVYATVLYTPVSGDLGSNQSSSIAHCLETAQQDGLRIQTNPSKRLCKYCGHLNTQGPITGAQKAILTVNNAIDQTNVRRLTSLQGFTWKTKGHRMLFIHLSGMFTKISLQIKTDWQIKNMNRHWVLR